MLSELVVAAFCAAPAGETDQEVIEADDLSRIAALQESHATDDSSFMGRNWRLAMGEGLTWSLYERSDTRSGADAMTNRMYIDGRWRRDDDSVAWMASDRLNVYTKRLDGATEWRVRNVLREAAVTLKLRESTFVDFGRINVRYGVAMGFSPMDIFKRRAIADSLSEDPVASREDRMGNVMGRVQHFSGGLSWTAVVAPKVSWSSARDRETGLHLSRTNDQWKFLISLGVRHQRGSTIDAIAYRDGAGIVFGAALTEPIGINASAYVEWTGGRGMPLGDDQRRVAWADMQGEVALWARRERFSQRVAAGASVPVGDKFTANLEYHLNLAAPASRRIASWATPDADGSPRPSQIDLHAARVIMAERGDLPTHSQVFARVAGKPSLTSNLTLSTFAFLATGDRSGIVQLNGDYALRDSLSISGTLGIAFGRVGTAYGSSPEIGTMTVRMTYYR